MECNSELFAALKEYLDIKTRIQEEEAKIQSNGHAIKSAFFQLVEIKRTLVDKLLVEINENGYRISDQNLNLLVRAGKIKLKDNYTAIGLRAGDFELSFRTS